VSAHLALVVAQAHAGAEPRSWLDVLRHDVSPVLAAYLAYLGILVAHGRRRRERRHRSDESPARWPDLLRYLASTVAGGYLFFLVIVVVFYFILGSEPTSFLTQALGQGSLLTFGIVVPGFLGLSWIADRVGTGRTTPPKSI
jgi:Family of unknown function (DUF6256)